MKKAYEISRRPVGMGDNHTKILNAWSREQEEGSPILGKRRKLNANDWPRGPEKGFANDSAESLNLITGGIFLKEE
jgi:hypothetical protein